MIRNTRGFTLIEMIGVLAIISILAAVLIPNLISSIDSVSIDTEQASMKGLASSLEDYIIRTKSIPSEGTGTAGSWAWSLASQSAIPFPQIHTNKMGVARQFIIDPAFGNPANATAIQNIAGYVAGPAPAVGIAVPLYTQQITGLGGLNIAPQLPPLRVIIVSDMRKTNAAGVVPAPLITPTTPVAFNNVWDQALPIGDPWREQNGVIDPATGLVTNGDVNTGLVIQRISLAHLFHRVVIASAQALDLANPVLPSYKFEDNNPAVIATTIQDVGIGTYEFQVFHGTRLNLYNDAGLLAIVQLIKGDESFQNVKYGQVAPFTFLWER